MLIAVVLGLGSIATAPSAFADTTPGGGEGCIANSGGGAPPGNVVYKSDCSYTATRNGGYVSGGSDWSVTITRQTGVDPITGAPIFTTISYSSAAASKGSCTTAIIPKDVVAAHAGANSSAAVGNPILAAADGSTPPSSTPPGTCP
jgi:hypothetical protein